MKNKPLTKKQRKDLIDALAGMNCLCAYLKDYNTNPENFGDKFDLHTYAKNIYKLLDSVIKNIDDSDLRGGREMSAPTPRMENDLRSAGSTTLLASIL